MIQVLIANVTLDNFNEFGMELGLQDSVLFDRSVLSAIQTLTNTTQTPAGNTVVTTTNQSIVSATNTPARGASACCVSARLAAMAWARSMVSSAVTQTGQPGPCTSSISGGSSWSRPVCKKEWVCPRVADENSR